MTELRNMIVVTVLALFYFTLSSTIQVGRTDFHQKANSRNFEVVFARDTGDYQLLVKGGQWLRSAPTYFTVNGKRYSSAPGGGLKLVSIEEESGLDTLGPWNATAFLYTPEGVTSVDIRIIFKTYTFWPDIVLFGQFFSDDVEGSSTGNKQGVSSAFPNFQVASKAADDGDLRFHRRQTVDQNLGFLAYGGIMFGDCFKKIGRWNSEGVRDINSGLDSGPLVLFTPAGDSVVLSAFQNMMAMSTVYGVDGDVTTASWGVFGNATRIPRDFSVWTIASYSSEGINQAIRKWGEVLRTFYGRSVAYRDSDLTNNYIGYWTDNGAYYYYNTEGGQNYEDTLLQVAAYARLKDIPYRYIQYDSWFYYKSANRGGVTKWTSMPDIFPDGLYSVWNNTNLLSTAHNRWWSENVTYASQNGGDYKFIVERNTHIALPLEERFWIDLFRESRKWGLIVYEQDWLNDQFNNMDATGSNVTLGRQWLLQMGGGARMNGLTIQYCMAPSRVALQSLEVPVVSQARVSTDYTPGNDQWKIGVSSMFAHAIGVAPFKDNFWTTSVQPGNPYQKSEPFPELQSVVATLSTGPVAFSDKLGYSNRELIMRSCNSEGLILKPSKPATAIDMQMYRKAFGDFHCEIWSTFSDISNLFFGIIFAADCAEGEKATVYPSEAGFGQHFPDSRIFSWFQPKNAVLFSEASPLLLSGCKKDPFCLYLSSPSITIRGWELILLGELNKWVPMSPGRIKEIRTTLDEIYVTLSGGAFEKVTFSHSANGTVVHTDCVLSASGSANLSVLKELCIS